MTICRRAAPDGAMALQLDLFPDDLFLDADDELRPPWADFLRAFVQGTEALPPMEVAWQAAAAYLHATGGPSAAAFELQVEMEGWLALTEDDQSRLYRGTLA